MPDSENKRVRTRKVQEISAELDELVFSLGSVITAEVDEKSFEDLTSQAGKIKQLRDKFVDTSKELDASFLKLGSTSERRENTKLRFQILNEAYNSIKIINESLRALGADHISNIDPRECASLQSFKTASNREPVLAKCSLHLDEDALDDVLTVGSPDLSSDDHKPIIQPKIQTGNKNFSDPAASYLIKADLFKPPSQPFTGKPGTFNIWSTSLKNRMKCVALQPLEQLQILHAHTSGTPQIVIGEYLDSCEDDEAESVVELAWTILRERYGSAIHSSQHILQRLRKFPQIQSSDEGEQLSLLLDICRNALRKMTKNPQLDCLNHYEGMSMLSSKLPTVFQNRWRTYGVKNRASSGSNPTLSVFVSFLQIVSREVNDDFFRRPDQDSAVRTRQVRALATVASQLSKSESVKYSCPYHSNDSHSITDCRSFARLSFDKRKHVVKEARLCFRCLGSHIAKNCDSSVRCSVCSGSHVTAMHRSSLGRELNSAPRRELNSAPRRELNSAPRRESNSAPQRESNSAPQQESETQSSARSSVWNLRTGTTSDHSDSSVYSKTMLVEICHPESSVTVTCYAIVDEQSNKCFADPELIRELKITPPDHRYALRTLSGISSNIEGKLISGLRVKGYDESKWFSLPKVLTNNMIPDTRVEVATRAVIHKFDHLRHLSCKFRPRVEDYPVLLLLGADAGAVLFTKCYGTRPPYAHHTPLGWALVGCDQCGVKSCSLGSPVKAFRTAVESGGPLNYIASDLFPGVHRPMSETSDSFEEWEDDDIMGRSVNEQRFLEIMQSGVIKTKEGKLQFPLPFYGDDPVMPHNREAVRQRTLVTLSRLARNREVLNQCVESMLVSRALGHIEELSGGDRQCGGNSWWLPVFAVTNPRKDKARLVFDAAAKYSETSLNSVLLTGPDLGNNLRDVLLKFRTGLVGFACDIKHMFHCFALAPQHRDYMRFFWFRDGKPGNGLSEYRSTVHIFGATSSPAVAAFGLKYIACSAEASALSSETRTFLHRGFYVDDGVFSVDDVSGAVDVLRSARRLLSSYGLHLHKFVSSHPEVSGHFREDIAGPNHFIDLNRSPAQRTLGVVWDVATDRLVVRAEVPNKPFTKRGILSTINSLYDPIGLASPVILGGRLIQRLILPRKDCSTPELESCGWDTDLPSKYEAVWTQWKESLPSAENLRVSRCFRPSDFGGNFSQQLHVFSDASLQAIGYVIYLLSVDENGSRHVAFVTAGSRVSPRGASSMPRLELCAALEASGAAFAVRRGLNLDLRRTLFYSDSKVTLAYLRNTKRAFSNYVTRRVEAILRTTEVEQWNYIPTSRNIADLASRPSSPQRLIESDWLTGPPFLWQGTSFSSLNENHISVEELPEEKTIRVLCCATSDTSPSLETLAGRVSSWQRLINTIKRIRGMSIALSDRARQNLGISLAPRNSCVAEADIERIALRSSQAFSYPEVVSVLRGSSAAESTGLPDGSSLSGLAPFLDPDGLMRVGGRLSQAPIPFEHRHPIILNGKSAIARLLIIYIHSVSGHQGQMVTRSHLRQKGYHIHKGTKVITDYIGKCVICRKLRGTFGEQQMSDLPAERITQSAPFDIVGIDVFGPFSVYDGKATRRTVSSKKINVLLVTCMVSRAVHLEILGGMDTVSFIHAIRRFFAVRGICRKIYSDCGTNFLGATSESLDFRKVRSEVSRRGCEWHFNPPGASHYGGTWERKIGAVRRALESTLLQVKRRPLSRDEMTTFLLEAAASVNSTPLYAPSSNPQDPFPITPAVLLTLKEAPHASIEERYTPQDLFNYGRGRWRRAQFLADQFFQRWRQLYIHELTTRRKWKKPRRNFQVDDVVLLRDKRVSRNEWPMGRISSVKLGRDQLVRSVELTIGRDGRVQRGVRRSIHDLVLLVPSD